MKLIADKLNVVATRIDKKDDGWWLLREKTIKIEKLIEVRVAVVGNVVTIFLF